MVIPDIRYFEFNHRLEAKDAAMRAMGAEFVVACSDAVEEDGKNGQ